MGELSVKARIEIAKNPATSGVVLAALSKDWNYDVVEAVAANPNCPQTTLRHLVKYSNDPWERIRYRVAKNPNCPEDLLLYLIDNSSLWKVFCNIAANPSSTLKVLKKLAKVYSGNEIKAVIFTILNNPICDEELIRIVFNRFDNIYWFRLYLSRSNCPEDIIREIRKSLIDYSLSSQENEEYLTIIINHPNCPSDLLEEIYMSYSKLYATLDELRPFYLEILKHPNCSSDFLRKVIEETDFSLEKSIYVVVEALKNPNCPVDLLERFKNSDNTEVLKAVATNKNCPREIIMELLNKNSEVKSAIINGPNCPIEVALYKSNYIKILERINKNVIIPNVYCYFLIDLMYEDESNRELLLETLMYTLLSDKCEKHVIDYLVERPEYARIKKNLDPKLLSKIEQVYNQKNPKFKRKNKKDTKKSQLLSVYPDLEEIVGSRKPVSKYKKIDFIVHDVTSYYRKEKNNTDLASLYSPTEGIQIQMHLDSPSREMLEGVKHVEYGEFPQDKLSDFESWVLDRLYDLGLLVKTEKKYKIQTSLQDLDTYEEYIYLVKGVKFVKVRGSWFLVKPITWFYNSNLGNLLTEKGIYANIVTGRITDINSLLDINLLNNIMVIESDKIDKSRYQKQQEKIIEEERKQKEKEQKAQMLKEMEVRKEKEKKNEEEIANLQNEIFKLLEKLNERRNINNVPIAIRYSIDLDDLLIKTDECVMINPNYINYLKYIDLSLVPSNKLKVSGIDFRGTNIRINPQMVYKKDLSNSKFSDENIVFMSFEGCDLRGTDISEEKDSVGMEYAILDENTSLPNGKSKK